MANEAYRAVFLRIHPTGKMVLSLTTEADGRESEYQQLTADQLGVPPLDVKVVPADTDRFGNGHGFNTAPSPGIPAAITSATDKILDKARLLAGAALDASPETLQWRERFGYELSATSRNLDALRDGFDFRVPDAGGVTLVLRGFAAAWREDAAWCRGLLDIVSETSLRELALGRRFFATLVLADAASPLVGKALEGRVIPSPYGGHFA